jgi:hypothetical protein
MTVARRFIGALLIATGGVWFFQGIGVIHGSFMTNQTSWTIIGIAVVVVGIALVAVPRRRRSTPPKS